MKADYPIKKPIDGATIHQSVFLRLPQERTGRLRFSRCQPADCLHIV